MVYAVGWCMLTSAYMPCNTLCLPEMVRSLIVGGNKESQDGNISYVYTGIHSNVQGWVNSVVLVYTVNVCLPAHCYPYN